MLIGHCHADPILTAARERGVALEGFSFWRPPHPTLNEDRTGFHPEIAAALAGDLVISAVGGGVHTVLGLVAHPVAFDFELPWRNDLPLDTTAMLLPYSAARDMMAHHLQEYLDIISLVRAGTTEDVYHVEAPPPLEDNARIHPDVPWIFYAGYTREVAPPALRYKLWRLASRLTQDHCASIGVGTIPCPAASMNERGFLREEFSSDATHVTSGYGALVLRQIEALR